MNESAAIALILSAPLLIPATWLASFLWEPWPPGSFPQVWLIEVRVT